MLQARFRDIVCPKPVIDILDGEEGVAFNLSAEGASECIGYKTCLSGGPMLLSAPKVGAFHTVLCMHARMMCFVAAGLVKLKLLLPAARLAFIQLVGLQVVSQPRCSCCRQGRTHSRASCPFGSAVPRSGTWSLHPRSSTATAFRPSTWSSR